MPIDKELLERISNNDPTLGEELVLSNENLDDEEIKQLCKVLAQNKMLTSLNVNENQIGDEGAKALAQNRTLTSLKIGNNQIGDEGAKALAQNKTLTSLNVGHNKIGDEGAKALAQNKTLTFLNVAWNEIGNKGAKALIQALQSNYALEDFCFSFNEISEANQETIERLIERNRTLRDQFHQAAQTGDIEAVKKCLKQGVSLASTSGYPDNTALHWAVQKKQKAAVKFLLATIEERDVRHYCQIKNHAGKTPLELAMILGNQDIQLTLQQSSSLSSLNEFQSVQPTIVSWNEEGRALVKAGKYEEAVVCFDRAINLYPKNKMVWYNKGNALNSLGKYEEAIVCFDQMIKLDTKDKEAWRSKGAVLFNLTKYEEAIVCLDQMTKLDAKDKDAWHYKARALYSLGKYEEVVICYNQRIKLDAGDKEAWYSKGIALNDLGQNKESIFCHDEAIRLDTAFTGAWSGKAYSLLFEGRFVEAETYYNQALVFDEHFSAALQGKGLLAYMRSEYSKADDYFKKAETHTRQSEYLHYRRGKAFVHFQALDKAKDSFQKALSIRPNFIPAQLELTKLKQLAAKEIIPQQKKIPATAEKTKPFATVEISLYILHDEIKLGKELGRGGFGIVFQGTWRYNDVAIKQLQSTQLSKDALEEFQQEMKIMARLRSPNIVQLYGITDKMPYSMIMEYLPKGDLYNLLHSNEQITWEQRAQIALDIARGLAYLHKENIMHRDLKSKNVLLDKNFQAKLADFGLAKIKTESTITSTGKIVGTLAWMAPELFKRKAEYTLKADIYSYGMVVWELSAREIPFEDAHGNQTLIMQWVSSGERDEIPKDTPKKLAELIQASWAQEPKERPTAEHAIEKLQEEETSTVSKIKSKDYRSHLESTKSEEDYRDNLDSLNKSFN